MGLLATSEARGNLRGLQDANFLPSHSVNGTPLNAGSRVANDMKLIESLSELIEDNSGASVSESLSESTSDDTPPEDHSERPVFDTESTDESVASLSESTSDYPPPEDHSERPVFDTESTDESVPSPSESANDDSPPEDHSERAVFDTESTDESVPSSSDDPPPKIIQK